MMKVQVIGDGAAMLNDGDAERRDDRDARGYGSALHEHESA